MYKLEKDFSKAMTTRLKKQGMLVSRVESHSTELGFPDAFVQGHGDDVWVELKNNTKVSICQEIVRVPWRPGQQAWHGVYYTQHCTRRNVVTLMSCKDGVCVVPNIKHYQGNLVNSPFVVDYKEWSNINVARLLLIMSHNERLTGSNREALVDWVAKWWPLDLDWDPEAIWKWDDIDHAFDKHKFNDRKFELFLELESFLQAQS